MTIFDYLKDVIRFKSGVLDEDPAFRSQWDTFMLIRWISMKDSRKGKTKNQAMEEYVNTASKLNRYQCTLSAEEMYKLATVSIPQDNNTYIKYITKPKTKKNAKIKK